MDKAKNYKLMILLYMLVAYTFFACIAHINIVFQVILYTIVIIAPLIFDDTKTISLYAYSACFMACLGKSGFLIALNISLLLLELKHLIIAIKTKKDLTKIRNVYIVWLTLLALLTIYSLIFNNFHIYRMGMFIDLVQCCIVCFLIKQNLNIKEVLFCLFSGIIISVLTSTTFQLLDIHTPFIVGDINFRFGAFFRNINTLAVYCTLCASCFITLIITNKLELKKYFYFPIIITLFGLLSYSKAFLLVNILLYSVWVFLSFIQSSHKKKFILCMAISILIIFLFCILEKDYILTLIDRFTNTGNDTMLGNITTGRTEIWKQYIDKWLTSPITFLFGNGYTAPKIASGQYEHSIYIAFLHQFGIIGTACIIGVIIWTMRQNGCLHKNITYYIPLGLLFVNGLVSNLSGVLCTCLPWMIVIYFTTKSKLYNEFNQTDLTNSNAKYNNA